MKKQTKEKVVAVIRKGGESIDMVPYYFIKTVKPIKSGSILRWDKAESTIVAVYPPEHP